ncbi:MAG TPA: hypothetical protein VGC77_21435 [Rhodopseudomonas sp.]
MFNRDEIRPHNPIEYYAAWVRLCTAGLAAYEAALRSFYGQRTP